MKEEYLHVDRKAFKVFASFEAAAAEDKAYWLSRTPYERLRHLEYLRRMNYGPSATARLQRVLEITSRP